MNAKIVVLPKYFDFHFPVNLTKSKLQKQSVLQNLTWYSLVLIENYKKHLIYAANLLQESLKAQKKLLLLT